MNDSIVKLRGEIDNLDKQLYLLLDKRIDISRKIQELKLSIGLPTVDHEREKQILSMSPTDKTKAIMRVILKVCKIQ